MPAQHFVDQPCPWRMVCACVQLAHADLCCSSRRPACCPWPMPDPAPMDRSSSSLSTRHRGSTASTWCLGRCASPRVGAPVTPKAALRCVLSSLELRQRPQHRMQCPPTSSSAPHGVRVKQVKEGMDVVKAIERKGSGSGTTSAKVTIANCGELKTKGS